MAHILVFYWRHLFLEMGKFIMRGGDLKRQGDGQRRRDTEILMHVGNPTLQALNNPSYSTTTIEIYTREPDLPH